MLLLLLLSHFSCVRLCATPQTAAHQAPPSLGFSRQEHWSGLPSPSPMHESEKWTWSRSVISLSDRVDCSLPGSSVHGIFQARVLEWGAIAFSTRCYTNLIWHPITCDHWVDAAMYNLNQRWYLSSRSSQSDKRVLLDDNIWQWNRTAGLSFVRH